MEVLARLVFVSVSDDRGCVPFDVFREEKVTTTDAVSGGSGWTGRAVVNQANGVEPTHFAAGLSQPIANFQAPPFRKRMNTVCFDMRVDRHRGKPRGATVN